MGGVRHCGARGGHEAQERPTVHVTDPVRGALPARTLGKVHKSQSRQYDQHSHDSLQPAHRLLHASWRVASLAHLSQCGPGLPHLNTHVVRPVQRSWHHKQRLERERLDFSSRAAGSHSPKWLIRDELPRLAPLAQLVRGEGRQPGTGSAGIVVDE